MCCADGVRGGRWCDTENNEVGGVLNKNWRMEGLKMSGLLWVLQRLGVWTITGKSMSKMGECCGKNIKIIVQKS